MWSTSGTHGVDDTVYYLVVNTRLLTSACVFAVDAHELARQMDRTESKTEAARANQRVGHQVPESQRLHIRPEVRQRLADEAAAEWLRLGNEITALNRAESLKREAAEKAAY